MLNVTTEARSELHEMLTRALAQQPESEQEELGLRLVAHGDSPAQLALALDAARPGDAVVEHDGRSVLLVDAPTSELLGDVTLDVVETPEGTKLGLRK